MSTAIDQSASSQGSSVTLGDPIKAIAAFFIPPLGVFFEVGITKHFWINVVLTILLPWIGGFIHALYIILTRR